MAIDQMAELFQRDRSVIGKHVRNIFKEQELMKEAVWAKFAYTASDGKTYQKRLHINRPWKKRMRSTRSIKKNKKLY